MAVTFTVTTAKVRAQGDALEVIADVACTGVPTVGGDALTAAALGLDGIDFLDPCGGASNVGATAMAAVNAIHGAGANLAQVLIAFSVQAVAGAATAAVAYTGNTAGMVFRVRAQGKSGKVRTAP